MEFINPYKAVVDVAKRTLLTIVLNTWGNDVVKQKAVEVDCKSIHHAYLAHLGKFLRSL